MFRTSRSTLRRGASAALLQVVLSHTLGCAPTVTVPPPSTAPPSVEPAPPAMGTDAGPPITPRAGSDAEPAGSVTSDAVPPSVAPPQAATQADEACSADSLAAFVDDCLDDRCVRLPVRTVAGTTFYACDDVLASAVGERGGSYFVVWGARRTATGFVESGPFVVHDAEAELPAHSVLEERRVESVDVVAIGGVPYFVTAVSYVVSGEVPDGDEPLYEFGAELLVSVCREDGVCPMRNVRAWASQLELRPPYRAAHRALARRGMPRRDLVVVDQTRVTVIERVRLRGGRTYVVRHSVDVFAPASGARTAP